MVCPNCGRENREDARFCDQCGVVLDATRADLSAIRRRPAGRPEPPRQQGGGGGGVAATCIIIAVVLGVGLFVLAMLAAILFPVFARAREKAQQASCMSNVKQLELAALMYDQDYHQLPDGSRWCDEITPYIRNSAIFVCPQGGGGPSDYAINSAVAGISATTITQPAAVVSIFDSTSGWNQQGGASIVAPRHNNGANIGFVDGHVKWVNGSSVGGRTWTPTISGPAPTTGGP